MTDPKINNLTSRYEKGHLFRSASRLAAQIYIRSENDMMIEACLCIACETMGISPSELIDWRRLAWDKESAYTRLPF